MSMDLSLTIKGMLQNLTELYYAETKLIPIPFNVEFVDNVFQRKLELDPTAERKDETTKGKDFLDSVNGTVVLPLYTYEEPTILIANTQDAIEQLGFISTYIHELTHIHDYFALAQKMETESFDHLKKQDQFGLTYYYSEFNATRWGYSFYRRFLVAAEDDFNENQQLLHIKRVEMPFQLEYLTNQLNKNANNATLFLYNILRFLGRYAVWQKTFPDDFDENTFPIELQKAFDNRLFDLYRFLYCKESIDCIFPEFASFHKLLSAFTTD